MDTEARLHRLEKRTRWFTWALALLSLGPIVGVMEWSSRTQITYASTLRANQLQIVNSDGMHVATVGADVWGNGFLELQAKGASLFAKGLTQYGGPGEFALGFSDQGAPVMEVLWDDQPLLYLGLSAINTPLIALKTAAGTPVLTAALGAQDEGRLQVADKEGLNARFLAPVGY